MSFIYPTHWSEEQITNYVPEPLDPDMYDISCSEGEIDGYLRRVRACIRKGDFYVETENPKRPNDSRKKNDDFIAVHSLSEAEIKDKLLSIDRDDFCHVKLTEDGRRLYVFCKRMSLPKNLLELEVIAVYVKHDYIESDESVVVISFHALEEPIETRFAD